MVFAAHAVRRLPALAHVTHVHKIDDHDASIDAAAFGRLRDHVAHPVDQWDFVGQRVIRTYTGNRRWHFDKVSKESHWHQRPRAPRAARRARARDRSRRRPTLPPPPPGTWARASRRASVGLSRPPPTPALDRYLPWADGAASYVLSARSMDTLIDAFPVVDLPHILRVLRRTEIYEDIMVGKVLYSADIEPREQDFGAVWTPEA